MTKIERRETRLLRTRRTILSLAPDQPNTHAHHVAFAENDPLPDSDDAMHHQMSESKRHPQDIYSFERLFPNDPATKVRV